MNIYFYFLEICRFTRLTSILTTNQTMYSIDVFYFFMHKLYAKQCHTLLPTNMFKLLFSLVFFFFSIITLINVFFKCSFTHSHHYTFPLDNLHVSVVIYTKLFLTGFGHQCPDWAGFHNLSACIFLCKCFQREIRYYYNRVNSIIPGGKQYYRTNTRHNPNTIHLRRMWPWPTACLKNYWGHMVIIYKWVSWTNILQYDACKIT